jgi:hypothetical protein
MKASFKASFNVAENGSGSYRLLGYPPLGHGCHLCVVWHVKVQVAVGRASFSSSTIVHLLRGYRYLASGERLISSVLSSLPLRRCLQQVLSSQSCQPSVRFCDHVVILFHDAGGGQMELID